MSTTPLKPKILIVDDTSVNIRAMRGMLAKVDCEILTANSGQECLALAGKHDLALILLDVQMPEMDGFQVASALAERAQTKNIPIIFVTAAFTAELDRMRGYTVGAVDYLPKPVDGFILRSKVQIFLELYSSRQELRARNQQLEIEIAERQRAEANARHQAMHDPLTGLPNRLLFMDRLQTAMARSRREQRMLALVYLDIDRFKPVNDRNGHHAGDALLREISGRLLRAVRKSDTVARLGGDEFAVILEDVKSRDEAAQVASLIEQEICLPFTLVLGAERGKVQVEVGASLGIAMFPGDADSEDELIRVADATMYRSKQAQRG